MKVDIIKNGKLYNGIQEDNAKYPDGFSAATLKLHLFKSLRYHKSSYSIIDIITICDDAIREYVNNPCKETASVLIETLTVLLGSTEQVISNNINFPYIK